VRIEELINYFTYDYAVPANDQPFAAHVEVGPCPWAGDHQLVHIGLQGKVIPQAERQRANLVFLIDVSGSMNDDRKLPLLKTSLAMLVRQLQPTDRVAIVVYAGASGLALPSTTGDNTATILHALERLEAGGSTNGGEGIELAYRTASEHLSTDGVNRVILCTDGDFNVGITSPADLTRLVEDQARSGVYLTVLGFGMGNYKDATLEKLADRGNGNYAYIDSSREARKVLVEQFGGTLVTIAQDVKIQVDFNPAKVGAYRLIGYENRLLAPQDFHDDAKDAGEIGAGHSVTALYEIVPPGKLDRLPRIDASKYQRPADTTTGSTANDSDELLTIKLRYKLPGATDSQLADFAVHPRSCSLAEATADFRFAAAVASFGMLLRDSPHAGDASFDLVLQLAESGIGADHAGHRVEFVQLVNLARQLSDRTNRASRAGL
jgi:Ca-activated chloride channel family protein